MKTLKFYIWLNWFRLNILLWTIKWRIYKDKLPLYMVKKWLLYDYLDTVIWSNDAPIRLQKKWSQQWDYINYYFRYCK